MERLTTEQPQLTKSQQEKEYESVEKVKDLGVMTKEKVGIWRPQWEKNIYIFASHVMRGEPPLRDEITYDENVECLYRKER